jgi:hypothetical protein
LGIVKPQKQLNDLIDWLGTIHKVLPELELVEKLQQNHENTQQIDS